ncbi:hypothetical protein HNP37_000694 [Flavobacterium nitrogenifigens]|uniref:Uncharacterized protein n=2 Tax=Flavobacterium TaxID=237 RepID=A0A7W7IVK1_9FLAO|nr:MULTISPECIES: hypothetical protein [Flavobacterium]MBB4800655.1 hypothetical protein [Flavobacterium nitrogenifigens]MBB6385598.1 hypothetical protein [Flavobacterium notoginsengisoli]
MAKNKNQLPPVLTGGSKRKLGRGFSQISCLAKAFSNVTFYDLQLKLEATEEKI